MSGDVPARRTLLPWSKVAMVGLVAVAAVVLLWSTGNPMAWLPGLGIAAAGVAFEDPAQAVAYLTAVDSGDVEDTGVESDDGWYRPVVVC